MSRTPAWAGVLLGLSAVWPLTMWLGDTSGSNWSWALELVVYTTIQGLVVAALVRRARIERAGAGPWLLLAAAVGANLAGDLVFILHDTHRATFPVPAPSDAVFLISYVLLTLGLGLLLLGDRRFRRGERLDGLILGLAISAAVSVIVYPDVRSLAGDNLVALVGLLNPLLDLFLLTTLAAALVASDFRPSRGELCLWVAVLLWTLSDVLYLAGFAANAYRWPAVPDLILPLALAMLGVAATLGVRTQPEVTGRGWTERIPPLASTLAVAILVAEAFTQIPAIAEALATAALALTVTRQFITLSDLDRAAAMHQEARTDALTGLPNRRAAQEFMAACIDRAQPLHVLSIDVDGFRQFNQSMGHDAGDELLATVAERLQSVAPAQCLLGRMDGDEFVLVAPGSTDSHGVARTLLSALAAPVSVNRVAVRVHVSVGAATYPTDATSPTELLRAANVAMFVAKRQNQAVANYRPELDPRSSQQQVLQEELREALDTGVLQLAYQPQCRFSDGRVVAVEALLRWPHPKRGLLTPGTFIEQAESSGLICELTDYVLLRALRDLSTWRTSGTELSLSVNISGLDLARRDLPDVVEAALDACAVPPELLTLELTETVMTSDMVLALRQIARLQGLGIRISMDDFGIGYSSLSQALSLPLDEIKLDRSLVAATKELKGKAILRTAVRLARVVGASVVAEGAEDLVTINYLYSIGVDRVQGFAISKALGADSVAVFASTIPAAMRLVVPQQRAAGPPPTTISLPRTGIGPESDGR